MAPHRSKGITSLERLKSALGGRVLIDEPMSRHTSFRIGGPAELFVSVGSIEELCKTISLARENHLPYFILGGGTNILVSDEGIRGLVIENKAEKANFKGRVLYAESGISLSRLARQAIRRGLGGLEWAVGIPGTIGGAIVNNAGAYGFCIGDVLKRATILDATGEVREISAEEMGFGYRNSRFKREGGGEIVLSAEFDLSYRPRRWLERVVALRMAQRKATQPSLPSAGSVFKNPSGDYAGRLIEEAGLKGKRIGDAQISPKHANFIVNLGEAKASDVKALIDVTRDAVYKEFGVWLELEIELVGEWER
jgi:UDP-N-acetylmuramate dehydrogenase